MQNSEVFYTERQPAALVVVPLVNISSLTPDQLQAELNRVLAEFDSYPKKNLVFDLAQVSYFGSVMLVAMQKIWKRVRAAQGRMALCGLSEVARDVLRVSNFEQIWPIYPARDEALHAMGPVG